MKKQEKNKIKKIGKKAVVSTTITWVVATILIFFILILFIAMSGIASFFYGKPTYYIIGEDSKTPDLASVKTLPAILSIEENGKTIKEHILEWAGYANEYAESEYNAESNEEYFQKEREKGRIVRLHAGNILNKLSKKTKSKMYYFYIKHGKFRDNLFRMSAEQEQGFAIIDLQKNKGELKWNEILPTKKKTVAKDEERARDEYIQLRAAHFIIPFEAKDAIINQQINGYFYLGQ